MNFKSQVGRNTWGFGLTFKSQVSNLIPAFDYIPWVCS
ncbi:hypothetical protein RIR_e69896_A0A2I1FI06_9GLOM [Rhizophagus irregularis DAOM 181602=DAOM 197198]|nr:hypothetical protein RIR_e69896_A0A2I1FI06_9GLOM [Rhizophagus irregularis DAOM 181602=DAOM 197198]